MQEKNDQLVLLQARRLKRQLRELTSDLLLENETDDYEYDPGDDPEDEDETEFDSEGRPRVPGYLTDGTEDGICANTEVYTALLDAVISMAGGGSAS